MMLHQPLGSAVQVHGSAIVAQTFPMFENIIDASLGQGAWMGKTLHESFKVGDDGSDLRLLKHDLADPNRVGIARGSPWHGLSVASKPGKQTATKPGKLRRGERM